MARSHDQIRRQHSVLWILTAAQQYTSTTSHVDENMALIPEKQIRLCRPRTRRSQPGMSD